MKQRVSQHHSRIGKSWHNDREFSGEIPEHIDPSKTKYNTTWKIVKNDIGFEQSELEYYKLRFQNMLDLQNEKYEKKRNFSRVKTMDQLIKCNRYKPEETIFQIGDKDNCPCDDGKLLKECFLEYISWEQSWSKEHNNCVQILDYALHVDEPGAPHVHCREVWQYQDDDGIWKIGQDEALKRAGVPLPDETKPKSQHNNRKKTFDEMRRQKWMDICEEHKIDVERIPRKRKHLGKDNFIEEKEKEQERLEQNVEDLISEVDNLSDARDILSEDVEELQREKDRLRHLNASESDSVAHIEYINEQAQTNSRGKQAEEQLGTG